MPAASFDGVNIQSCHLHFSGGSTKFPAQPGQACSTGRRCQAEPNTEAEARQRNLGRLGHGEAGKVRPEKNASRKAWKVWKRNFQWSSKPPWHKTPVVCGSIFPSFKRCAQSAECQPYPRLSARPHEPVLWSSPRIHLLRIQFLRICAKSPINRSAGLKFIPGSEEAFSWFAETAAVVLETISCFLSNTHDAHSAKLENDSQAARPPCTGCLKCNLFGDANLSHVSHVLSLFFHCFQVTTPQSLLQTVDAARQHLRDSAVH